MGRGRAIGIILVGGLGVAGSASASELRFSQTTAGNVVATGNALGLSKEIDVNGPGIEDSIGTFATLGGAADTQPPNPGNPWFAGTTSDWTESGAEAVLELPATADVLYAELIWGGSTLYGAEDVTTQLGTTVTFGADGDEISVSPAGATALTIQETSAQGFAAHYYMRSADVTDFVDSHHATVYSVQGVPGTQDDIIDQSNASGWTLVVAYHDSTEPIRNLSIFVGGSFVDEDTTEDYLVEGFCTPPSGAFAGNVIVSAMEGDASRSGDGLAIAETALAPFTDLMGPNNPVDNFFCSQINDGDGQLDTSGTFGDRNHNAAAATNVAGARQGWDITRVPVGSADGHLANGQTSATIRTQTLDDSYVPTLVAFGLEVNAPDFTGAGSDADPLAIADLQTSTVTIRVQNVGLVDATGLILTAPLPAGLELDSFALDGVPGDITGAAVTEADLVDGVEIGDGEIATAHEVTIVVRSVNPPSDPSGMYLIDPGFEYRYVSCVGEDALVEPHELPQVAIDFIPDGSGSSGGVDESGGVTSDSDSATSGEPSDAGDESGNTETGGVIPGSTGGQAMPSDGCGCRSSTRPPWSLALLVLLFVRRRRRR